MKIVITGAHSTGKTTLINEFVKLNHSLKFHMIPEVAREMIISGYPMGKNGDTTSYTHYIQRQLEMEIASENIAYDYLIADRSIIDGVAHPIINKRLGYSDISEDFIAMFERILHFQKSFYDLYVYVPIKFNIQADNLRDVDENYRSAIDTEIKHMLDKHVENYFILSSTTLNDRCNELMDIVNKVTKHNTRS